MFKDMLQEDGILIYTCKTRRRKFQNKAFCIKVNSRKKCVVNLIKDNTKSKGERE